MILNISKLINKIRVSIKKRSLSTKIIAKKIHNFSRAISQNIDQESNQDLIFNQILRRNN